MLSRKYLHQLVDHQQFSKLVAEFEISTEEHNNCLLPIFGLSYAQLGQRKEAVNFVQRSEKLIHQLDLDAQVDLAGAYCVMCRFDDAEKLLRPALAEQPDHSLALARLAFCRLHLGDLDTAREIYLDSARIAPHRLPVWSSLARLYLQAENFSDAQKALDQALEQFEDQFDKLPENVQQLFTAQLRALQIEIWVASDQLAEADVWLEQRRETLAEDEWVSLLSGYANVLAGHDRHEEASTALREARKHYKENRQLISQLAEIAQLQGRTQQAIQLLRHVIRLAEKAGKPTAGLWARMSGAQLHQRTEQARKAAEKAIELVDSMEVSEETPQSMIDQLIMQSKNALAQVESQEQNYDKAEKLFNELLELNPWFLPALQGLGQQQMQRGRIDEAIALFEKIKQIDPAKGYSSLINARQFPEDELTLKRMEKAARQPSLEGSVRSGLLYQLASAWEKRKDYDKAFEMASLANSSSKKHLGYDPQKHRQRCARIRHVFSKPLYEHRRDCGVDSTLPVFVLGMPRSGTTLVEQIIGSHSKIFGAGELGLIPQRIAGLERWNRHIGSGRHYPDCVDDLNAYVTNGIADGILDELKLLAEEKPLATFVVDKLPHNFENIGFIKFLFPKAKIISVRRDPRDIALSNYFTDYQAKHGGMGFAYDMEWIGQQLADHNLLMHHWNQVFPGEILEVNYEDVVEDTESQARLMLSYIGVEWEPAVLSFNKLDRPVKTASVWQVRQPIYKTSKAKWKRYEKYLATLIKGTNAKIEWEPIEMTRFPVPGIFNSGIEFYKQEKLDEAEYEFKKVLYHFPDHAGANFMTGLIYVRKGHLDEGIDLMEKGLKFCPWNRNWRKDLIQACELAGKYDRAAELKKRKRRAVNQKIEVKDEIPLSDTSQHNLMTTYSSL